ncbi:MAG: thioredoxin family protein [Nanoarchaeota archaeon]|nr:thioredoxin family protein [Nanoarchaeota archaeon]MCG2717301.1 thioredoxin family protein [Nanoarchaeota archaeon]
MSEKKHKVKVFSTPSCSYCSMEKDWLKEHKIEFEDIDVSMDQEAANKMVEKSGQMGVPVTDIDGEIVVGFDKEKLKKLLDIKE